MDGRKMFECSDDDFSASSHDEDELIMIAKMHVKEKHGQDISDEEAKSKIKEV